ncbi:DNA polymerase I [Acutalibacter muris]|uniref:DNA polymerase I n=1 Tax=Acutalibacter muris TaxID=1796620 RepID=A0A1Z2XTP9_9FIRM|nr:DNA polymerase I [Acutalibacter muris]ANU54936.1 DNA polymerase I [Hungateiclostridiaceae bacterium KB18]ASB41837.1 DNA polymerase I [Acutalibacter muris]QQR31104.1 DNA polymerase I [Acutalibacter muris]
MKLLVLDGNSLLNRAFFGIKLLSTKSGDFTNGIYGFLTMFRKIYDETEPDAVAIAFDMRAPTFRHKQYAGYKSNRKGMPEELAQQLPVLQQLLKDLGYRIVTCEGWEADDILGTLSAAAEREGSACVIATGDRDSLQLVSSATTVRLMSTKFGQPQVTVYDEAKIMEEYGVTPHQMIDLKALQGDSSDCIPGVAGIGPKGAGELVQKYGSLENIYNNLDDPEIKPAARRKLEASKDNAFMSYELGTIRRDAPIETDLSQYVPTSGDPQSAGSTMVRLELFSLIEKFGLTAAPAQETTVAAGRPEVIELPDGAPLLARLEDAGAACFYCHWDKSGELLSLIFAHKDILWRVTPDSAFLLAFFTNPLIKKHTHDIKPLHRLALSMGCKLESVSLDTALAAYLLNPSATGYDVLRLAAEYSVPLPDFEQEEYNCAAVMPGLCQALQKAIDGNNQRELLENIEIPLSFVLAQMEHIGFYVDSESIKEYGEKLQKEVESLHDSIIEQVGYDFNINSPKQLGEALFEKLGLPHGKKTKSGWSTNADVLESLRPMNPVVDEILRYRTVAKLKSTYCDGLLKVIGPDGRIHSSFNQTETRTGRISSTEPNMQNIPVRTPIGRELRKFFAAEHGVLVDADYSQIELRVLAHVANDPAMREDFLQGHDIHASTAARVFNMPQELITSQLRSRAKAVNFGIVYGIGAYSLSQDIGVSVKEADAYIKEYLRNYSGVDAYMKEVADSARETGYVEDMFGRRRYLPELKSSNFNMRSFGERVARNMPIQGAAADIIKIAMIRVSRRLEAEGLKARMILQVHDELIVECPQQEQEQVKALLTEEMEQAVNLSVPMVAEANAGKTWYDAKG